MQVPPSVLNGLARFREREPPREPRASLARATGSDRASPSGGRTSWRAKWWSLFGFRPGLSLAFRRVNRQVSQVVIPVRVPSRPELRLSRIHGTQSKVLGKAASNARVDRFCNSFALIGVMLAWRSRFVSL